MKLKNLIGKQFGRLTVIEYSHRNNARKHYWKCKCSCGNNTVVLGNSLTMGKTRSCGCYKTDSTKKRSIKHGMRRTKLWQKWNAIKSRCLNKNNKAYMNYGGRGITIYDEWKNDFVAFKDWALVNGYKDGLQIDRINNNGNYTPDNCRFITQFENANNTRHSHYIEYAGEKLTISQFINKYSESSGINPATIKGRLLRGWSPEKTISNITRRKA